MLDDGSTRVTNRAGRYRFSDVVPEAYQVSLVPESLPLSVRAAGPSHQDVSVKSGKSSEASFGLAAQGRASGLVYRDLNHNARRDADEPTVASIMVETADGTRALTDRRGRYVMVEHSPEAHALSIAEEQPFVEDLSDLRLLPLPDSD